jgi:hypothetical protein
MSFAKCTYVKMERADAAEADLAMFWDDLIDNSVESAVFSTDLDQVHKIFWSDLVLGLYTFLVRMFEGLVGIGVPSALSVV